MRVGFLRHRDNRTTHILSERFSLERAEKRIHVCMLFQPALQEGPVTKIPVEPAEFVARADAALSSVS
jgi:hypothetical protein